MARILTTRDGQSVEVFKSRQTVTTRGRWIPVLLGLAVGEGFRAPAEDTISIRGNINRLRQVSEKRFKTATVQGKLYIQRVSDEGSKDENVLEGADE